MNDYHPWHVILFVIIQILQTAVQILSFVEIPHKVFLHTKTTDGYETLKGWRQ